MAPLPNLRLAHIRPGAAARRAGRGDAVANKGGRPPARAAGMPQADPIHAGDDCGISGQTELAHLDAQPLAAPTKPAQSRWRPSRSDGRSPTILCDHVGHAPPGDRTLKPATAGHAADSHTACRLG